VRRAVAAAVLVACLSGCAQSSSARWSEPNANTQSTRFASGLGASRAGKLRQVWRFAIPPTGGDSGAVAATPVVSGTVVYLQDLKSNVYALDRRTGALRWEHRFEAQNPGPNGVAVDGGRVIGATDTTVFSLDATNGKLMWKRRLLSPVESFVDAAPLVDGSRVYIATTGYSFGTRGKLYALDERTGAVEWQVNTIKRPWPDPAKAGGGGAWSPPSLRGDVVYWGTANPIPWGGTPQEPNGAAFPGAVLFTDSLLALDAATGRLLWYDQVTPHDVRDYDFQLSPILVGTTILGAGKAGRVIAWDASTHRRLWSVAVGLHRNDRGPLPARRVAVCPGLLGGVETPMAEAAGRLFVPVVDLCVSGSATGYQALSSVDPLQGRGELVALSVDDGRRLWVRRFPAPDFGCATASDGVVFTSTLDGSIYGLDAGTGRTLWHARAAAGINACPSIAGGMLFVAAGVPVGNRRGYELVAYAPRG